MPNQQVDGFFEKMEHAGLMLTYDDVRLRTRPSDVDPSTTDLSSKLTRNVPLRTPIISSPMDTVTTGRMAIAMAAAGGAGTIYRMADVAEQARMVRRAKFWLNALIATPITVRAHDMVDSVRDMRRANGYPFETFPVLNDDGQVVGLVSGSDFDFCSNGAAQVASIMTQFDSLVTLPPGASQREAYATMIRHKKKVVLLLEGRELRGMYVLSDLRRILGNTGSMYNVDKNGQLIVGAAIGAGMPAIARAEALAEKNCDYFQIDTAHGDSRNVIETILELKKKFPHIDVLAGNVSSAEGAANLARAGADGVLVGQGPGSICTTRVIAGVGVPQVSAVYECAKALRDTGVPVCADGGIGNSGDMVIALAVGASSVMMGRLLAGTEESPGETRLAGGVRVKDYRGMGSLGALRDNVSSRERYRQQGLTISKLVPEGVEGIVPYQGPVADVLAQYTGGIRSGLGYLGAHNLEEMRERAQIFRISNAGLKESHPHDITIVAEAPNYHQ